MSLNDNRHDGVSSHSFSSSIPSSDADIGWIDAFCRDFASQCRCLDVDDTQKVESHKDLTESSSWESLLWPAFNCVCFHLHDNKKCTDLAKLAQVSTHYYSGVNEFMKKPKNRPAFERVDLSKQVGRAPFMGICLYPSNFLFYGLNALDMGRFRRYSFSGKPGLCVEPNGTEDPIIDQVSSLLSGHINCVEISNYEGGLVSADLSLFAQLLRKATIGQFRFHFMEIDDSCIPSIIDIASRAKELDFFKVDEEQLSDKAAFITQLASMD
ncbi:hypothetical protein PMAYCL1PPCAC_27447, partial [Pristionchus mayeri]